MRNILFCLILYLTNCLSIEAQRPPLRGLRAYGKGEFWYKLVSDNKRKPKPSVGDQVCIDYAMLKGERVLSHSYDSRHKVLVQIPEPGFDNFFTHALELMGKGDSLLVQMPAARIPEYLGEFSPLFGRGDWVTFTYKMHGIKPAAVFKQELEAERLRADSLRRRVYDWTRSYGRDSVQALQYWNLSESGLYYNILEEGDGASACMHDALVQMNLIALLADASIVYDSFEAGRLHEWRVGSLTLIEGVAEGVCMLREGGSALLLVPPHLGYGSQGIKNMIPPDAVLAFYVEVVKVE